MLVKILKFVVLVLHSVRHDALVARIECSVLVKISKFVVLVLHSVRHDALVARFVVLVDIPANITTMN